jgi:hypothetical protein
MKVRCGYFGRCDEWAWFELLGTKVTLCLAKLPVAFAANYSGIRACAKNRAILCLTKCYPALNHADEWHVVLRQVRRPK